jgi:hypothetical protein
VNVKEFLTRIILQSLLLQKLKPLLTLWDIPSQSRTKGETENQSVFECGTGQVGKPLRETESPFDRLVLISIPLPTFGVGREKRPP